ncbi:MAG TPA: c-type cytochrome [Ktedonobacterales bacterium]|nr:c-type cytochrome [Ktedonobacterales bacterium]
MAKVRRPRAGSPPAHRYRRGRLPRSGPLQHLLKQWARRRRPLLRVVRKLSVSQLDRLFGGRLARHKVEFTIAAAFFTTLCLAFGFAWASSRAGESASSGQVRLSPQALRGQYLVMAVGGCTRCHGTDLSGGRAFSGTFLALDIHNAPVGVTGTLYAPNLTPDVTTGLGSWTADQLVAVFRQGVDRNGRPLRGPMPLSLYSGMSDDDIQAIVAYLRSIPAVYNLVPKSDIVSTQGDIQAAQCIHCHQATSPLDTQPATPDSLAQQGAYLGTFVAACVDCHTPRTATGAYDSQRVMQGGVVFVGPWGTSVSADLTAPALATWTDADFARAIQQGVTPDGRHLAPPMPYATYAHLSPEDLAALIAYMRVLSGSGQHAPSMGMASGMAGPPATSVPHGATAHPVPARAGHGLAPVLVFFGLAALAAFAVLTLVVARQRRAAGERRGAGRRETTAAGPATELLSQTRAGFSKRNSHPRRRSHGLPNRPP